jgi:hypothetical protein
MDLKIQSNFQKRTNQITIFYFEIQFLFSRPPIVDQFFIMEAAENRKIWLKNLLFSFLFSVLKTNQS